MQSDTTTERKTFGAHASATPNAQAAASDENGFTFVLFGGTGDLAHRKILPALYQAHRDKLVDPAGKIVAVARKSPDRDGYLKWVEENVKPRLVKSKEYDDAVWKGFLERIEYVKLDAAKDDFAKLTEALSGFGGTRVFYLATVPSLFVPICQALAGQQLNEGARIVLEKPLGYDLESSKAINDAVGEIFQEEQIYRIDHYLGKEPVQNLLALRFGNILFEPLWRREFIQSIQITIAEELGVETRGDFYDGVGALRDMVQNHLLQLLAIVAMEPPHALDTDSVRDEKLRVLRALKQLSPTDVSKVAVRGQYLKGVTRGESVPGYLEEEGVNEESLTETFVALKVEIENWRWAGVPFYLRTGKRLADRTAEIVVNFRQVPHSALPGSSVSNAPPNRLVIRLQPHETIRLYCQSKQPGDGMQLQSVYMDLDFNDFFRGQQMEAYERLLLDVIHGRLALFVRRDEQEAAWRYVMPILDEWSKPGRKPKGYAAGSWGPPAASAMLAHDGTYWLEEEN